MKYTLLLFLLLPLLSIAQTKQFSGPFVFTPGLDGQATFTYQIVGGDTIRNGKFQFKALKQNEACGTFQQHEYTGQYVQGNKQGTWNYTVGEYQVDIVSISGTGVKSEVAGQTTQITANYHKNLPHGQWTISVDSIFKGKPISNRLTAKAQFTNGKPSGSFNIATNTTTIEGQFDGEANYDGTWRLSYTSNGSTVKEERLYSNGFLLSLVATHANGQVLYNVQFNKVKQKLLRLKNETGQNRFEAGNDCFGTLFNDGFPPHSLELNAQHPGNRFIDEAFQWFATGAGVMTHIAELQTPCTRRFKYVHSEADNNMLARTSQRIDSLTSLINGYMADNTFVLHKNKTDSLAYTFAFYQLTTQKLAILDTTIKLLQSEPFQYQSRTNYFREGVIGLETVDTLKYEYDGTTQSHVIAYQTQFDQPESIIDQLDQYSQELFGIVTYLHNYSQPVLEAIKKESRAEEQENHIITLLDSVQKLYLGASQPPATLSAPVTPSSNILRVVFDNLVTQKANLLMQEYTLLPAEERPDKGLEVIGLLDTLIALHPIIDSLPQKLKHLDEAYTYYAYNPYMDRHDIKTRSKRRLYNTAVTQLWPYLIGQLATDKHHIALAQRARTMEQLYHRLIELSKLSDAETAKLEKRMRRENNMEKVIKLLDL